MASVSRHVHLASGVRWAKLKQLAPDLDVHGNDGEEPFGLAFLDPDGENQIFVFSENGRQELLKQITGGLVIPKSRVH